MTDDRAPRSPCISVCVLDDQDVCQGCFRTAGEITDWMMVDAKGKKEIIERAKVRLAESMPFNLN